MRIGKPASLVRTAKIDGPLCQPQSVSDIPHMNQQDILKMCKSYSKSEKRLILIGKHRIPDNNEEEKKEIDAALLLLAAERRDEIWMVISEDVKEIEDAYGHIPNLNFAGHGGIQFSKKNTAYVELPDASRIEGIEAEANRIVQELNNPLTGKPSKGRIPFFLLGS
ncbi:hypothetical protein PCANC_10813 [Puccinia coronata f. sp. avenae]|uniref:Uncharacterized protein n=1 Tax=Puccinia coronata f. sp. avenae TaxID=200324 RepID=A0A2N5V4D5_9BASI|nr:hypothetical protein PCANC_10813 [Puccinia coronata f. sp. avenae]